MYKISIIFFLLSTHLIATPDKEEQLIQLPVLHALKMDDYDFSQFALVCKNFEVSRRKYYHSIDEEGRAVKRRRFTVAELSESPSSLAITNAVSLDRVHCHQNACNLPLTFKAPIFNAQIFKHLQFLEIDVHSYQDFSVLMAAMQSRAEVHITVGKAFTEEDLSLFKDHFPSKKRKRGEDMSPLEKVSSLSFSCKNAALLKTVIERIRDGFIKNGQLNGFCPSFYLSVTDPGEYDFKEMLKPFAGGVVVVTKDDIAQNAISDHEDMNPGLSGKRTFEIMRLFKDGDLFNDRVGSLFLLNDYQPSSLRPAIDLVLQYFPQETNLITTTKIVRAVAELPEGHRVKVLDAIAMFTHLVKEEELYLLLYALTYFPASKLDEVAADVYALVSLLSYQNSDSEFAYNVLKNLDLFWRFDRQDLIKMLLEHVRDEEDLDVKVRLIHDLMLQCANRPKAEWGRC